MGALIFVESSDQFAGNVLRFGFVPSLFRKNVSPVGRVVFQRKAFEFFAADAGLVHFDLRRICLIEIVRVKRIQPNS